LSLEDHLNGTCRDFTRGIKKRESKKSESPRGDWETSGSAEIRGEVSAERERETAREREREREEEEEEEEEESVSAR
jgi:hypothetical protein